MRFSEIYREDKKVFSLEFFPPKKEEALSATLKLIEELSHFNPDFMTVTYGAGGGTRGLTREMVSFIHNTLKRCAVSHLTCVSHSVTEIDAVVQEFEKEGVCNILALRGDPPRGETEFIPPRNGFSCARDLVKHLSKRGTLSLAVAGYPETHQNAKSPEEDLRYLKEKVDAGAEIIITQLFFDNSFYFRFVENLQRIGVTVPVIPGIMPIANVAQVKRFTSMCGASIPDSVMKNLTRFEQDTDAVRDYGTEHAINQCKELLMHGAPGIHLYTLNSSIQAKQILTEVKR